MSRQAKHYAHKGINTPVYGLASHKRRRSVPKKINTPVSCDKAFQNPCHSAKRERKYVQQHIRICTHGVKTGLG